MRKILFTLAIVLLLLSTPCLSAEVQLESNMGWFFEKDHYIDATRSFNGFNANVTLRYFFGDYVGLYLGINPNIWFSADNDDYLKPFEAYGMEPTITDDIGVKINFNFGLALRASLSEKLDFHSDIGIFYYPWGIEAISGNIRYMGSNIDTVIGINPMSGFGFSTNVFGSYGFSKKTYVTFGIQMLLGLTRKETIEFKTGYGSTEATDNPDFLSFSIAPFIGILSKF